MWADPVAGVSGVVRVRMVAAILACGGLAGCVEPGADLDARASAPAHMMALAGVSPRGAPVAFASVEGAPAGILARFAERTRSEAGSRDIDVAETTAAKYLVRGYLNAYGVEGGATVTYVWDVFDGRHVRVQRVEDALTLRGSAGDPWALVDDKALGSLAARSADDLAAILSNMPEAVAAARSPGPRSAEAAIGAASTASSPLPKAASAYR